MLVGEVSTVNDDNTDNKFYQPVGRFPDIEEEVAAAAPAGQRLRQLLGRRCLIIASPRRVRSKASLRRL